MHLMTEQRVLLHIHRYVGKKSEWEAPYEVSQAGISGALHLPQSTISRTLKSLKSRGLIEDRVMYIRGEKRKKSAYFLTPQGFHEAERTLEELKSEPVKLKSDGDVRDVTMEEAVNIIKKEKGVSPHPLELHILFNEESLIDINDIYSGKKGIAFHVPRIGGSFVGRKQEISLIKKKLGESPVIVVKGMAGMGKSTLLSKVSDELIFDHHLFWYRIRKTSGLLDLMKELNEFLRLTGRKAVERKRGSAGFFEELRELNAILIFDDLQYADKGSLEFLRELADNLFSKPSRFRMIFSGREEIPIFRREGLARGMLYEIRLMPLKKEELREIFPSDEELEKAYALTGGVPLFIELYKNAGFRVYDAKKILDEEILSSLSEDEMKALKSISVHRIPVYPEAFSDIALETLEKLRKKMLINEVEIGRLDMHDLLKELIYRSVPMEERKKCHKKAVEYYLSPWCGDEERFEAVYHLQMAGEWKRSAETALKLASEFPISGNVNAVVTNFRSNMDRIPDDLKGELLVLMGDILAYSGRWSEAVLNYGDAERYLGKPEELEERIARASYGMENWDDSIRIEEELLKKAEKSGNKRKIARHLIALGNIYMRSGDPKKAVRTYLRAEKVLRQTKSRDGLATVYNNLGSAYVRIGDMRRAEKNLRESLKYSGGKGEIGTKALSNLAYIYETDGKTADAEKAYTEALKGIKKGPDFVRILERLARIMTGSGRWEETLRMLEKNADRIPEEDMWRIRDLMADAYRKGKKYENAMQMRRRALSLNRSPGIRISLIEDVGSAGRFQEALRMLEEEEKRASPWDYETMSRILLLKGNMLALTGEKNTAIDAYGALLRMAEEAGDEKRIRIVEEAVKKMRR